VNAIANGVAGKGFENQDDYKNCELKFCDIENIHAVRDSAKLLAAACTGTNLDAGTDNSGWFTHIRTILRCTFDTVKWIDKERGSVVVHCSDGWDRTSQICALAEMCVDPYYRTVPGFMTLVQKDFCSFGHQFHLRSGHLDNHIHSQRAPIFLLFLDCVYQLQVQFPSHFQFNSLFLAEIAHGAYSCRFGTFAFNCQRDNDKQKGSVRTVSMWTYLLGSPAAQRGEFLNPLYNPHGLGGRPLFAPEQEDFDTKVPDESVCPSGRVLYPHAGVLSLWRDWWLRGAESPHHYQTVEGARKVPESSAVPFQGSGESLYISMLNQLQRENAALKAALAAAGASAAVAACEPTPPPLPTSVDGDATEQHISNEPTLPPVPADAPELVVSPRKAINTEKETKNLKSLMGEDEDDSVFGGPASPSNSNNDLFG
jgi:hypothetical protein